MFSKCHLYSIGAAVSSAILATVGSLYVGCGFCKDVAVCVDIYQKGALWISTNGFSRSESKKNGVGVNRCLR